MSRRTVGNKYLTKEEMLKALQDLSDDDSGSEINSEENIISEINNNISDEDLTPLGSESELESSDEDANINTSPEACNDFRGRIVESSSESRPKLEKKRGRKKLRMQANFSQNDESVQETANDGTIWKNLDSMDVSGRRPHQNILREVAGPTSYAMRRTTDGNPCSAWRLFINEKIMRHIKHCTEVEAREKLGNPDWNLPLDELDAFISLLYVRGIFAAKGLPILSLWSKTWGLKFFIETMPRDRFLEILKYLRFDLKSTRSQRLPYDQFALISEVWNVFIENCILCYKPGENITVDEQLFPTKTRCRFIQYMPKKPDKFGIKFWLACDVETKYLLNGFPYLGKDETRPAEDTVGEHAAYRLLEPFYNTGRNVTTDNFFTSLKLAKKLRSKGISCVGTVNRGKKEVPNSFKNSRDQLHSSKILEHDGITLTSYQGKKNKNVILMSTLHPTLETASNEKHTPEVVAFYNKTKFAVDVIDQMARKYSVKSSSRRWPVHVFFNILDLAAINAWIIYRKTSSNSKVSRREYILDVAKELRRNYISSSKSEFSDEIEKVAFTSKTLKRKQCQINKCKRNKTVNVCANCKKYVCGPCTGKILKTSVCINCKND